MMEDRVQKRSIMERNTFYLCVPAILAVAGVLPFFPSFSGTFLLDDFYNIFLPSIMMKTVSIDSLAKVLTDGRLATRPVSNITLALSYAVHGSDPLGYHVVNLGLHFANGLLIFILFSLLLRKVFSERDASLLSLAGTCLWILHPVQPQTVTYIVQRMTLLSTFFFLLGYLAYVRAEGLSSRSRYFWWGLTAVCYVLSVLSKEMTFVLPFLLFMHTLYFGDDDKGGLLRKGMAHASLMVLVFLLVYGTSRLGGSDLGSNVVDYSQRAFTMGERVLTQFRIMFLYLGLIIFPTKGRLMLDHYVAKSTGIFTPFTTFMGIVGVFLLLLWGIYLFRRHRFASFCILWFFVTISVESSFIPLEMMFEHRLYIPMLGVIFFILYWGNCYLHRFSWGLKALVAFSIACSLVLGHMTYERNLLYQDAIAFWKDNVAKAPEKARVHNNLGNAYYEAKQYGHAIEEFRTAMRLEKIDWTRINTAVNLSAAYLKVNRADAAIMLLKLYSRRKELPLDYYYNMGYAYFLKTDYDRAMEFFLRAREIEPGRTGVHFYMGRIQILKKDYASAIENISKEIEYSRPVPHYYYYLGYASEMLGKRNDARKYYMMALTLKGSPKIRSMARQRLNQIVKNK